MRILLGFLSGCLGLLAGWFGLAMAVVGLAGPDRDGGIAMGAFFQIGPIGGLIGFGLGVWLFVRFGLRPAVPAPLAVPPHASDAASGGEAPPVTATGQRRRISRPFAVVVLAAVAGLGWWAWYELIRSPYLTHGFMTLELQFRLPAGTLPPLVAHDVEVEVEEGDGWAMVTIPTPWIASLGDRPVILARAALDRKTRNRVVHLKVPGVEDAAWRIDLSSDPDPTADFSPWRAPTGASAGSVELAWRLTADR